MIILNISWLFLHTKNKKTHFVFFLERFRKKFPQRWAGIQICANFFSYVFILLYITVLVPLEWFFLIASIQGATMDVFLVFSYILATHKFNQKKEKEWFRGFVIGSIAASFHLVSIIQITKSAFWCQMKARCVGFTF